MQEKESQVRLCQSLPRKDCLLGSRQRRYLPLGSVHYDVAVDGGCSRDASL